VTTFDPRWVGIKGVFGGFVLGRMVDAADAVGGFSPQAVTIHFLAAVQPKDAELTAETLHRGRATVSRRIELRQDGRLLVHAVASLVPSTQEFLWWPAVDPAPWGDPEVCADAGWHHPLPYQALVEVRPLGPGTLAEGAAAWVRLCQPVPLGPHGVASVFLDLLPPGLFALDEPPYFVPTIDFTVHFAPVLGDVVDGWHLVTNRTVWATRDVCVDESAVYDRAGRLLAQMRQGRAIRWPHLPGPRDGPG
jgi:acyl-CoA thioesterase